MSTEYTGAGYISNPVDLLLGGHDTEGRVALVFSIERSGCEPPLHRHRNEDEIVYVLAGELTFYVNGERRRVLTGECLLLRRGVEHGYRVESEEACLLTVVMPSGLESYFLELDKDAGTVDIERLVTVAARYGIEITGPPPAADPQLIVGGAAGALPLR
ncbi:MAG: cupin domain-containing protein [Chloroflexota bacterium]|nr:cupin domain-containing protein [Chloroflexota bacterium]